MQYFGQCLGGNGEVLWGPLPPGRVFLNGEQIVVIPCLISKGQLFVVKVGTNHPELVAAVFRLSGEVLVFDRIVRRDPVKDLVGMRGPLEQSREGRRTKR